MIPTDRRIRLMYVDPGSFMAMFKEGLKVREDFKIMKGIPLDAQLLAVSYDPLTYGVIFVVYSKEFENIPQGQELPKIAMEIRVGR